MLAENVEMRLAPGGDVLVVVAVGDRAADYQQQDLRQRVQDAPHVARFLHRREMRQKRRKARPAGKSGGGLHHLGRRQIRAAASIQQISRLSPVI